MLNIENTTEQLIRTGSPNMHLMSTTDIVFMFVQRHIYEGFLRFQKPPLKFELVGLQ